MDRPIKKVLLWENKLSGNPNTHRKKFPTDWSCGYNLQVFPNYSAVRLLRGRRRPGAVIVVSHNCAALRAQFAAKPHAHTGRQYPAFVLLSSASHRLFSANCREACFAGSNLCQLSV